ncbi:MAG TPA: phospho-N-acetylmuramoyl-pentapeptide-transferase, partial [Gemmatimonadaceae bacterium]|nr:phospho-N-acetylmuramoyl-pentapeptide-transferase [Gemmatimonadaceae bacterium]
MGGEMLNYLLYPLSSDYGFLRLFNYISFRAAGAAMTALLTAFVVGPFILSRLRSMNLHQVVREGTPAGHSSKSQTPTMGGLIILVATILPTLLWMRLNNRYVIIALVAMVWMGVIGFMDDFLKLKQKREGRQNTGMVEAQKLLGQLVLGFAIGYYIWKFPLSTLPGASTTLPFYKYMLIVPASQILGWLYVGFVTFVMTGASNAVNITDGLDG